MASARQPGKSPARKAAPRKKAAAPRKAAPRKAAARRLDGDTNGERESAVSPSSPDRLTEAQQAEINEAIKGGNIELASELIDRYTVKADADGNAPKLKSPYPDHIPTWEWTPVAGGPPIVFPHFKTVQVDKAFLWMQTKLPDIVQGFKWMELAGVPDDIQFRVVNLPDGEYEDLFTAWFKQVGATVGESQP